MRNGWAMGLALFATGASATAWIANGTWERMSRGWSVLKGAEPNASYGQRPSASASAGSTTGCARTHPGARPPMLPEKMAQDAVVLCRTSFGLLHSGRSRTALWVSEKITRENVAAARRIERVDDYRADEELPRSDRAELKDYRRSGWDRGHMAANDDMPDPKSQAEAFRLSNITPQSPDLNRGSWSELESDVRRHVSKTGMAYVVTGVLYEGATVKTLPGGRVAIPTSIWKAVLSPDRGSVVMVARNASGGRPTPMSIDAFRARTGIDPFPAITQSDRSRTLELDSERAR